MKKAKQISESIEIGILLAISGGLMDAYSYLLRGQVFANAQTGNILLLGVHLSQGHFLESLHYFIPILSFGSGIALCAIIRQDQSLRVHWRQKALLFEILILSVVAFIPFNANVLANALISFSCGIQVQAFRKIHGSGYATTMCIGNLRSGIDSFCAYFSSHEPQAKEKGFLYFLIILCFMAGAILGSMAIPSLGIRTILLSSLFLIFCFILMFIDREKKDRS